MKQSRDPGREPGKEARQRKKKKKRKKNKEEEETCRSFSRSMTNFDATTSKQDAAYLLLSRLNAMRTRAVYAPFFPTIVRYEDNRLGSGLPYFLSSLFLSRSIDDGFARRSYKDESRLQVFLIIIDYRAAGFL